MTVAMLTYDKDVKELIEFQQAIATDGQTVGYLLRMSNDHWGVYDVNDVKLTSETASTPKKAFEIFKNLTIK